MAQDRPTLPDYTPELENNSANINPLALVMRRWPLLLVGLAVGALCGALIHVTSKPKYQSDAQLLVIKKRNTMSDSVDFRSIQVEDYVATQLTLIKSEKIRRAAARELKNMKVTDPLPDDEGYIAAMISGGLNATKEKDATSAIGSGVVLLTFRGTNPVDTKAYLEAVITAYKGELSGIYDQATNERVSLLNKVLESKLKERSERVEAKANLQNEKNKITTEDIAGVRIRLGVMRDKLNQLQTELIQINRTLAQIEGASKNRRDRIILYGQLTGQSRANSVFGEPGGPEQSLRLRESQLAALSEKLGKDHPQYKQLLSEINFFREEIARLNPEDPTAIVDELAILGKYTLERQQTIEEQIKDLSNRIVADERKIFLAGDIQNSIEQKEADIKSIDSEILRIKDNIDATEVTRGAGGYSASAITPPGFGYKIAPVFIQSMAIGLVLGVLLGGAAMGIAEYNDKSFRSPAEIRRRLGVPVIGHIPELRLDLPSESGTPEGLKPSLAAALRPKSAEAEAYRGVRTQLYFSTQGRGHQVIQVTSPNPGDGKSTLAANLAITIAQSGKRVVLIDCDMRKPKVHKLFELETKDGPKLESGLAEIVAGNSTIARALRRSTIPNLDLIPCGPRPKNPAELLTSPRLQQLISDLKAQYDFVIVDTPPVLAVSDPANVAPRVDGVILVFKMNKNARPSAERTNEQLLALGANILGIVVNGATGSLSNSYSGYNYGSRTGYRYTDYAYSYNYTEDDGTEDDDENASKKSTTLSKT